MYQMLEIWVGFDGAELRDNALQGLKLSLTSFNSEASSLSDITIHSLNFSKRFHNFHFQSKIKLR